MKFKMPYNNTTVTSSQEKNSCVSAPPTTKKPKASRKSGLSRKAKKNGMSYGQPYFNGLCYLALFREGDRALAQLELGNWPSVQQIRDHVTEHKVNLSLERVSAVITVTPDETDRPVGFHIIPGEVYPAEVLYSLDSSAVIGGSEAGPANVGETASAPVPPDADYEDMPTEAADTGNDGPEPEKPVVPTPEFPDNPNTEYRPYPADTGVADKPEVEAQLEGWMEWREPGDSDNCTYLGGNKYHTSKMLVWNSDINPTFKQKIGTYAGLDEQFSELQGSSTGNITIETDWGYGVYNHIDMATRPYYRDARKVALWSIDDKVETISAAGQQIMYDTPVSVTPSGRATALSSVLAPGEVEMIRDRIGLYSTADEYMGNAMTIAASGDTHIAALVSMMIRLIALKVTKEQGLSPVVGFRHEEYDNYFLKLPTTTDNIHKRVAEALNDHTPGNIIYMPRGTSHGDFLTMAYLLGMGRIEGQTHDEKDNLDKRVYSAFDRFKIREGFSIVPIIDGTEFRQKFVGYSRVGVGYLSAESVLHNYVAHHGLWSQLALARCMAFAMFGSPTLASLVQLPQSHHSTDWLLGMQGSAFVEDRSAAIVHAEDNYIALVSMATVMCRSAEEVFLEAIVNTAESAGVTVHHPNFKNIVDQYMGEDLPWGISHAILPVIEKLFEVDCEDLAYSIDRHLSGCVAKLSVNFKNRLFRESSYLFLDQRPNSKDLLAVQDKAVRDAIVKNRAVDGRQFRILKYLTAGGKGNAGIDLYYSDFYNDNLLDDRYIAKPPAGNNKYRYEFMEQAPTVWTNVVSGDGRQITMLPETAYKNKEAKKLTGLELLAEFLSNANPVPELDDEDLANIARPDYPELEPYSQDPEDPMAQPGPSGYENGKSVPTNVSWSKPQDTETGSSWFGMDWKEKERAPPVDIKRGSPPPDPTPTEGKSKEENSDGENDEESEDDDTPKKSEAEKGYTRVTGNRWARGTSRERRRATLYKGSSSSSASTRNRFLVLEVQEEESAEPTITELEETNKEVGVRNVGSGKTLNRKGLRMKDRDDMSWWKARKVAVQQGNPVLSAKTDGTPYAIDRVAAVNKLMVMDFSRMSEEETKWLDSLYPRGKDAEIKRAPYTVAHLVKEIFEEGIEKDRGSEIRTRLIHGIGGKNAWIVGVTMTIYAHTLTSEAWCELKKQGFLEIEYKFWNSKFSSYNDILRNSWADGKFPFSRDDFPQMLYISNLVGRPNREVDWEAETVKRSRVVKEVMVYRDGKLVNATTEDKRERILNFLNTEASLKVRKCMGFEDMYRTRYQWMIGGSMAGEKTVVDSDPVMRAKLEEMGYKAPSHSTKKHISERVSFEEIRAVLDMEPVNMAKGHTKGNENGKLRAIYGSLFSQYVIGRYWSYHIEQNLSFKHASMNRSNGELLADIERRLEAAERGEWIVCLDYTDFNASHSLDTLAMIISVTTEWAIGQGFEPTQEFLDITSWYSDSFLNSIFFNPGTQQWVRVLSGLFSGLPQTTFDNTIENGTLRMTYLDNLKKQGIDVKPLTCFELGDDGWISFATKEEAEFYLAAAKQGGIETNDVKQLLSKGRGEYLRLLYDNDGIVRGSPIRALANICSGSVESSIPSVGRARIQELYSNVAVVIRRGFNGKKMEKRFLKLADYELNGSRKEGESKIPVARLLYGSKSSGGMGLIPVDGGKNISGIAGQVREYNVDQSMDDVNDLDTVASAIAELKKEGKFLASADYISEIQNKFGLEWKRGGRSAATATLAARNAIEGAQDSRFEHQMLRVSAAQAVVDKESLKQGVDWWTDWSTFNMSAAQIEKSYGKHIVKDDRVMSTITPFVRIAKYLTLKSFEELITRLSTQIEVSEQILRKAFESLRSLKGEDQEYMPIPHLCQELMGLLTKWRVVSQFTGERRNLDPQWFKVLATRLRY
jgi:hypothetical protein